MHGVINSVSIRVDSYSAMSAISEASVLCMRSFNVLSSKLVATTPKYDDLMSPAAIENEYGRFRGEQALFAPVL
jgi:hypothetical protein